MPRGGIGKEREVRNSPGSYCLGQGKGRVSENTGEQLLVVNSS